MNIKKEYFKILINKTANLSFVYLLLWHQTMLWSGLFKIAD